MPGLEEKSLRGEKAEVCGMIFPQLTMWLRICAVHGAFETGLRAMEN